MGGTRRVTAAMARFAVLILAVLAVPEAGGLVNNSKKPLDAAKKLPNVDKPGEHKCACAIYFESNT